MANKLLAFSMLVMAEESTPPLSPMICSFYLQCLFYTMQDEISGSSSWKCPRRGYKPFLELSSFLHRLNLRKEGSNVAYMLHDHESKTSATENIAHMTMLGKNKC